MRTIYVGIAHNNYLVISELAYIKCFRILLGTYGYPKGGIDILNFLVIKYPMLHCLVHIEDFTS